MSAAAQGAPAHLILVGLPGAGKSTHGRRAAKQMQRPFIDLDRRIAEMAGRSVAAIFAEDGEEAFRAYERDATAALALEPASIVAPGGGWVMNPENVALVKPASTIVWLQVSPFVAVRRMGARIRLRPLLRTGNPVQTLEELLRRRQPRYATADAAIDTELLDWQGVVDAIAALAPPLPAPSTGHDDPGGVR
ncbi:MAG: shikimate kinase [Gemmatimonadota bacterium]